MTESLHPLQNAWVLWEHKSSTTKDPTKWKENMKQLCEFTTMEEFWQNFNNLPKPSEVFFDGQCKKKIGEDGRTVAEYSLFKKGIEPEWSDPQNTIGGEWFCRQSFELEILDLYWINLVMGLVGETIEDAINSDSKGNDHLNGVRVVDKSRGSLPQYRLEVWINTRDAVVRDRVKQRLIDVAVNGQDSANRTVPRFSWKDHV